MQQKSIMWVRKNKRGYLDWASATPVHAEAKAAFEHAIGAYGNPSSPHAEGQQAKAVLEDARTTIARLAAVKPAEIVFTSGATEANALAIQGRIDACRAEGREYKDMHVLYLPTMHSSVLKTIAVLAERGVVIEELVVQDWRLDTVAIAKQLLPTTVLVCCDVICGETGTRFNTRALRTTIDKAGCSNTAQVHVDASQLPLVESIERMRLGADTVALDAQKVGGVRGIGALIVHDLTKILPIMQGGGQEMGLRPGTEATALAASFAAALIECNKKREIFAARALRARADLFSYFSKHISDLFVNEGKEYAPHILNLSFPNLDTDYAVMLLNATGYAVSTKSACETDSEEGSTAVRLLTGDSMRASSTLRISWGPSTANRVLVGFKKELVKTIEFLKST